MVGTIAGLFFYDAFNEIGEAVAVGLMTTNITLHLAEVAVESVIRKRQHPETEGNGPQTSHHFDGFGGPAASTGAV
ncbi:hypothetical protein [Streptomyces sp. NPDC086782]|uniref:hypothetical protein n=1 Tax=Streptomyces sp. NPDC086782 TaxID=3365757 RepID=UPI00380FFB64